VNDITPFGDQAEITAQTNFFGTINVCNALFPLLRDHARFVFAIDLIEINTKKILFYVE
jgi:carbonyl reductase 1